MYLEVGFWLKREYFVVIKYIKCQSADFDVKGKLTSRCTWRLLLGLKWKYSSFAIEYIKFYVKGKVQQMYLEVVIGVALWALESFLLMPEKLKRSCIVDHQVQVRVISL